MLSTQAVTLLLVLLLTLISGLGDAQGFIHAARVWQDGQPVGAEIIRSALGFAVGVIAYWGAVRYLNQLGVFSPEVQTLFWFLVTIIGVALFSGRFAHWPLLDQGIALAVLLGISWLVLRTGG